MVMREIDLLGFIGMRANKYIDGILRMVRFLNRCILWNGLSLCSDNNLIHVYWVDLKVAGVSIVVNFLINQFYALIAE